ncbi:MAG: GGDEF domain-containing protein [Oscillospiraceae bacterium]|nr:GGDEF domain-containing protein [Oscillospiraceae bacterium]
MSENNNVTELHAVAEMESEDIMQAIQNMIGDLLKNAVDKMQTSEAGEKLGGVPADLSEKNTSAAQMDISEIKSFVRFMQKFIDNINVMIRHLETGDVKPGETDEKFIEDYMATADTILEIAAFSTKDNLTGFSNRYGFDNRIVLEWNRACRDKSTLGIMVFGVDGFSGQEDKAKHDEMINDVAQMLNKSIKRSTDFISRWSDDEFAILLPITDVKGSSTVAERILAEITALNIPGTPEKGGKATVSMGVNVYAPEFGDQPVEFIDKAYSCYVKSKESSKSTIVYA